MTLFEIFALYLSLFILMNLVLMMRIGKVRMHRKISLGDGGDKDLNVRVRTHGNFVETIMFSIFGLLALAMLGAPAWAMHLVGIATLIGRGLHIKGMAGKHAASRERPMGMVIFILTMLFTVGYILYAIITT